MSKKFIITGTDTEIGKTVFSAALMQALDGSYWKPFQSGIVDGVDTNIVRKLSGLSEERFFPEGYVFTESLSPHRAAELDDVAVDLKSLKIPQSDRALIIEAAGGLMVPLTRKNLQINLFKRWDIPLILCARTGLGTINHTLLSLEAIWARRIKLHGIVFIGEKNWDNMATITEFSGVKILGHLPRLDKLNSETLKQAFEDNFQIEDFI